MKAPALDDFLALSVDLTGFSRFRLLGTGQAALYLGTATQVVGGDTLGELLATFKKVAEQAGRDAGARERLLRTEILSHEKLGPIARNIIKLWFAGTWYALPAEWCEAFGAPERDGTFVPSPASYTEGLLWPTIGANPTGAKAPGYGTWAEPPRIPEP